MRYVVRDNHGEDSSLEADRFEVTPTGILFVAIEEQGGRERYIPIAFVPYGEFKAIRQGGQHD